MIASRFFTARVGVASGAILLTIGGCAAPSTESSNAASETQPQVVATSAVLCDLTRQIAQTSISLTCLLQPNQDPHTYTPTPSDRQAIEEADLVLYGGYGYEPSLYKLIEATTTAAPKIAIFEAAVPNPLTGSHEHEEHGHEEHGHEEEAEVEEATGETPDPHIWHDATNGSKIADAIAQALATLAPDAQYQQSATTISEEITQLDRWIKTQVATVPLASRQLVTPHDSFQYFANAYGFEIKGALEGLSTEQRPSATRLTELVDLVKTAGVPAIFAEATTNRNLIETVAKEANVQVAEQPLYVEGPGGDDTPAPTYQRMLVTNTCTVVNALGGECNEATAPIANPIAQ